MSTETLQNDPVGQALYRTAIVEIIGFAVEKLNDKAVYANTLVFSGRVLGTLCHLFREQAADYVRNSSGILPNRRCRFQIAASFADRQATMRQANPCRGKCRRQVSLRARARRNLC